MVTMTKTEYDNTIKEIPNQRAKHVWFLDANRSYVLNDKLDKTELFNRATLCDCSEKYNHGIPER